MKYTTDHKWKQFKENMDGYSIRYRGINYSLDEFVQTDSVWSLGNQFGDAPIEVHAYCRATYFSAVLLEISRNGEEYRIATVTT
tara:strand:+ start:1451 stop:1702 length:252 start_codon:yes stop_codon:yes gene_type:complete